MAAARSRSASAEASADCRDWAIARVDSTMFTAEAFADSAPIEAARAWANWLAAISRPSPTRATAAWCRRSAMVTAILA